MRIVWFQGPVWKHVPPRWKTTSCPTSEQEHLSVVVFAVQQNLTADHVTGRSLRASVRKRKRVQE